MGNGISIVFVLSFFVGFGFFFRMSCVCVCECVLRIVWKGQSDETIFGKPIDVCVYIYFLDNNRKRIKRKRTEKRKRLQMKSID